MWLEALAQRSAKQVLVANKIVSLRPMSAFDRRIIHVTLSDDKKIATESAGDEPNRHVTVRPAKSQSVDDLSSDITL